MRFLHVPGHQDAKKKRPLTLVEMYNVECDKRAKEFVLASPVRSTSLGNPAIEVAEPHLLIDCKLICRLYTPALREAAALPAYYEYLQEKLNWTQRDIQTIHWRALTQAIHGFHPNDQRRIVLLLNNKLPLRASKAHPHPGSKLCPSCQREEETPDHFFRCQNRERATAFTQLKNNLTKFFLKYQLHPSLFTSLWVGLTAVRMHTAYPDIVRDLPTELRPAVQEQTRLGWVQVYKGRVTNQWAKAIDHLHPSLSLAGCTLVALVIKHIWQMETPKSASPQ